jgi:hypothetical protein
MALKRLVMECKPNVILIQVSICSGEKETYYFKPWLQDWSFFSVVSKGLYMVLISMWSPKLRIFSSTII